MRVRDDMKPNYGERDDMPKDPYIAKARELMPRDGWTKIVQGKNYCDLECGYIRALPIVADLLKRVDDLEQTLAEERNENNVLRKNSTSYIKTIDSAEVRVKELEKTLEEIESSHFECDGAGYMLLKKQGGKR